MLLLNNPYHVKGGILYWRVSPMPQADLATFQHLGGDWGRDAKHVFTQSSIRKIDLATFELLNAAFAKDANAVYDWEGTIKGADPATFEVLDSGFVADHAIGTGVSVQGYARDKHAVYFHEQMFGRATAIRGADPATFVSLRSDYGYDARGVWFQKTRIPKADPNTWLPLGRWWSMDRDRIWFCQREVAGIDRDSFTIVNAPTIGIYATDGQRFFRSDDPITEPEFWDLLHEEFSGFENGFRVSYHLIRKTCTTCNGTGDCHCVRTGQPLDKHCARCSDTRKCHICQGVGRTPRRT